MPFIGCVVECRAPMLVQKIDVTARSNELLRDDLIPFYGREVERCEATLRLKIDVTVRSDELFCDGRMPFVDREVERSPPILLLKIDVTARSNELFCDGLVPLPGREVERCAPSRPLVVDEGLRAWCRQQRADLHCFAMLRGMQKLPRFLFPRNINTKNRGNYHAYRQVWSQLSDSNGV
jgi:hypothetical protein